MKKKHTERNETKTNIKMKRKREKENKAEKKERMKSAINVDHSFEKYALTSLKVYKEIEPFFCVSCIYLSRTMPLKKSSTFY